jgi:hypothetical protein
MSVAHRVSLVPYHRTQLTLLGEGAWELTAIGGREEVAGIRAIREDEILMNERGLAFE